MEKRGEIIIYDRDDTLKVDVKVDNETVWLTQVQIGMLFGVDRSVISKHLKNIYISEELIEFSTCAKFAHMGKEGIQTYNLKYYKLDAILSVGYRVNSKNATKFRQWANTILKEYLLKGYAINHRIEQIEKTIYGHGEKIDMIIKTSIPPIQGVFYQGQIFDAYVFISDLIKSSKKSIILIDNYIDESVFTLLSKREFDISATIYTGKFSKILALDLEKYNSQYPPIEIKIFNNCHDRFIIIYQNEVYHIGASIKDLGKKLFAFSKINISLEKLLNLSKS